MGFLESLHRDSPSPASASPAPNSVSQPPATTPPQPSESSSTNHDALVKETAVNGNADGSFANAHDALGNSEKELEASTATDGEKALSAEEVVGADNGHDIKETADVSSPEDAGEKAQVDEVEDESKYPKALPLYLLTFGLALATFVVALDNTIIGTSTSRICCDPR